ncbi:hypothetical protein [Sinorhizobium medicae]
MTAERWMRFYPSDWLGDPALRTCSYAARGLWVDMLCLMDAAKPRGHLKLGRQKVDAQTLATLTNGTPRLVEKLLAELQKAGVFSVNSRGTIYSRKMVREEKWSKKGKKMSAARWSQGAETKEEFGTSNARSMTPESRVHNKQESCRSRLGAARAKRHHQPDHDPPRFQRRSSEPKRGAFAHSHRQALNRTEEALEVSESRQRSACCQLGLLDYRDSRRERLKWQASRNSNVPDHGVASDADHTQTPHETGKLQ